MSVNTVITYNAEQRWTAIRCGLDSDLNDHKFNEILDEAINGSNNDFEAIQRDIICLESDVKNICPNGKEKRFLELELKAIKLLNRLDDINIDIDSIVHNKRALINRVKSVCGQLKDKSVLNLNSLLSLVIRLDLSKTYQKDCDLIQTFINGPNIKNSEIKEIEDNYRYRLEQIKLKILMD